MTYTCSRCGYQYMEIIPMLERHEHTYIAMVLREAACTEEGIRIYTCACGDTYTESIPKLAHSYDSRITREPTASAEGVMTYTCSRCSSTYTKPIDKIESTLTKTDSRPKSSNPSISEDSVTESSSEVAMEETDISEEQSIVTANEETETDAALSVVTLSETMDSTETDATESQFPWWILLMITMIIVMGLYVARRQKNKNTHDR